MKKFLLTTLNSKFSHQSLALEMLGKYKDNLSRHDLKLLQFTINQPLEAVLREIFLSGAEYVFFSCYIWNIEETVHLLKALKKMRPRIFLAVGGPEVSYDAVAFLKENPECDLVMQGEGEEIFTLLLDELEKDAPDFSGIAALSYRQNGEIVSTPPLTNALDMAALPFPYAEDLRDCADKIIYYESSRGCPYRCAYCLSSIEKSLRFRPLQRVYADLDLFLRARPKQVKFIDRTFNAKREHALAIWRYIAEHDNGVTNFHFEISADLLREDALELISDMRPGLIQLEIGVQSTNIDTITEIHRKMDFKKVADIVTRINAGHNIHQHLDLIAGLPYEDLESFKQSFQDVYEVHPEQLQLGFLKVLKGSYMEKQKENYGLVYKDTPPYEVLYTKWLPYEDVLVLKKVEEMVEVYYNSSQFSNTLRLLEKEFDTAFALYDTLARFYEEKGYDKVSHSRIARFEILYEFIQTITAEENLVLYKELLTYDLYLRENVKKRPNFAGDYTLQKDELRYINEEILLKDERLAYFGQKNMRKFSHMEQFDHAVNEDFKETKTILLFDYQNRDPLTNQATVYPITMNLIKNQ